VRPTPSTAQERRPASAVPSITGLKLMPYGNEAALVNISATGVLAESITRIPVGSPVEVGFQGSFNPKTAKGRVARCEVAVMGSDGLLRYHIAIEFDAAISFGDEVAPEPEPPPVPQGPRNRW
jgi:hypothetical protein